MKNYNKISIFCILYVFILASSVFADADFKVPEFNGITPQNHINKLYTEERKQKLKENVIRYDDIEDMIHLYNPEILSMWNNWQNNKSSNDIYTEYNDAADALESGGGASDVADAMMKAQAAGMRIQADMNYSDSYTNFLSNYATEKNKVLESKILYFNCLKSEHTFKTQEDTVLDYERAEKSAEVGYENGAKTYVDLLTAKKNLSDAKAAYTLCLSDFNTSRRNLFINCGKAMNSDATIVKEDLNFLADAARINFEEDYINAIKNNFQYEIYKKGKENATTDEIKKQMDININSAETKIYNDLQTKYNNLSDSIEDYQNLSISLISAKDSFTQSSNMYKEGSISKNAYLSAETKYNKAVNDFNSAIYDVNIAYITYKAAVEGLATC